MNLNLILFLILPFIINVNCELELVQDDELVNLIRSEKYVVALFTKKYCEECENFENELTSLREDLVESLNAWVVKLVDSSMTRLYTPNKEPAIVFFRHGTPLLYDGPLNDELILHTFTNNKEPVARELNDDNFEHLTQAASGATTGVVKLDVEAPVLSTPVICSEEKVMMAEMDLEGPSTSGIRPEERGDWFVQFYTTDCVDCQRLQARWEAVGAHLKSRMNVARVNRATTGAKTARRFNVFEVPAFILFKKGKMYKYHNHDYDVKSLISFAQDWYKNVKPEIVPVPKSPFDDLVAATVTFMKENPYLWQVGFGTFFLGLVLAAIMKFIKKSPAKSSSKSSSSGSQKKSGTKKSAKKE